MKTLIDQSGMVAESDKLSLSQSLSVKNQMLVDGVTGAKHRLHPKAETLTEDLMDGITVKMWKQKANSLNLTNANLMELFLFLNHIGAIEIKRTFKGKIIVLYWRFRNLLWGSWPMRPTKRWPGGIINIAKAILSAMLPLIILTTLTSILAYGLYISVQTIVKTAAAFLFIVWLSTVVHEYMHAKFLENYNYSYAILQKGLRIGVLHKPISQQHDKISAFLGPFAGMALAVFIGWWLGYITNSENLMIVGLTIAIMQALSWLPAYGDGQAIWQDNSGNKS